MNTDPNVQAILAFREKLKAMTPEQKLFAKMQLNCEYRPFHSQYFQFYSPKAHETNPLPAMP